MHTHSDSDEDNNNSIATASTITSNNAHNYPLSNVANGGHMAAISCGIGANARASPMASGGSGNDVGDLIDVDDDDNECDDCDDDENSSTNSNSNGGSHCGRRAGSHVNIDSMGGGPLTPLSCVKFRSQSPRSRSSSPRSRFASRSCSESPELEVDSPPMSPALRLNGSGVGTAGGLVFGGRESNNNNDNNNSPTYKSQVICSRKIPFVSLKHTSSSNKNVDCVWEF